MVQKAEGGSKLNKRYTGSQVGQTTRVSTLTGPRKEGASHRGHVTTSKATKKDVRV